jgi:hypothetical protein
MNMDLRLSPSGPDVGGIDLMPLRTAEDSATIAAPLVLTGAAQDVNASLRAELAGPFLPDHYLSAECVLDVSNDSTNVLAEITLSIEATADGGSTWTAVHTETHAIGANDADALRQIQPIRAHVPPSALANWGAPALAAEAITLRVRATMVGEAGNVVVEANSGQWLRLTEHTAPAP